MGSYSEMTRKEALEWYKIAKEHGGPFTGTGERLLETIDCYESLLARCRPWLKEAQNVAGLRSLGFTSQQQAELDALLAEIEEAK